MSQVLTWRALAADLEARLAAAGVAAPAAEARWILDRAAGEDRADMAEGAVPARAHAHVERMATRRAAGEPLQYVLGSWAFRSLDLFVDRRVLIPRPETEITAQVAIQACIDRGARTGSADPWAAGRTEFTVIDLGTGSGALALAIAAELPAAAVWATDASEDALAVARANLAGVGTVATRVRLVRSDWFDALPVHLQGSVRVLVSNPPYVSEAELRDLPSEVREHEPRGALVSGPTGLEAIEHIIRGAGQWLEPGGAAVVEIAPSQAERACALARAAGFQDVGVERDLSGRDRVLVACMP